MISGFETPARRKSGGCFFLTINNQLTTFCARKREASWEVCLEHRNSRRETAGWNESSRRCLPRSGVGAGLVELQVS